MLLECASLACAEKLKQGFSTPKSCIEASRECTPKAYSLLIPEVKNMNDKGIEIVTIEPGNVGQNGFFCYKSKPKSAGYKQKLDWLAPRFGEGVRLKLLYHGGRSAGFIEYAPAESAWRAVIAPGYMVIHCLWVVGQAKEHGYASLLLKACLEEAQQAGCHGVVMVSSRDTWLAGSSLFLKNGFEIIDHAPPSFELLVRRFGPTPEPAFPTNWEERLNRLGPGLTVVYAEQCPYMDLVVNHMLTKAAARGLSAQTLRLESSRQVQEMAPSAYGVFGLVYNGRLLTYHYPFPKELAALPVIK
jgi:GNAT superfamily N-acetyltransferase